MRRLNLLFLLSTVLLCGCRAPQERSPALTLRIAVNDIYCKDTACECVHHIASRTYAETLLQLKERYGVELQPVYYIEPYNLEKAILAGECDGAICKPWFVLRLEKEAGADFERVADILDPNNNRWLTGIVIVMADSPIQSLDELEGKSVVIGEPDAYEKHYAAKRLFEQHGLRFSRQEMTASCIENLGMLMDGKVDAAVVSDYTLSADCAVDFASPEDFRVLGKTERIPLTSVMLNANKVAPADRARVRDAILALCAEAAPGSLLGRGFVDAAEWNPPEQEQ